MLSHLLTHLRAAAEVLCVVSIIWGLAYALWDFTRASDRIKVRQLIRRGRELTKGADGRWDRARLTAEQEDGWADAVIAYYSRPAPEHHQTRRH